MVFFEKGKQKTFAGAWRRGWLGVGAGGWLLSRTDVVRMVDEVGGGFSCRRAM